MDADDPAAFDPRPGEVAVIAPGIRRVLAPNPSPMTFRGTNSYLLGEGQVTLIDPGPADPAHLAALLAALAPGERIVRILVTHSHADHSALAPALAAATGAPVAAHGDSRAGRTPLMAALAARGVAGGEGSDPGFRPDETIADGALVETTAGMLEAIHTPGHFGNHLSFALGGTVFSGDVAMGWATSIVSPPDGDMGAYMRSLARLADRGPALLLPGHGAPVARAVERLDWLARHRRDREAQIVAALASGPDDSLGLTRRIYADLAPGLRPAAERNVLAHLIDLRARGLVASAFPDPPSDWRLLEPRR